MAATSSGVANRCSNEVGRAVLKNSLSTVCGLFPELAAIAATKSPTPRERVGPASTLFTVMPVPAVVSAKPRATAICAAFVMP